MPKILQPATNFTQRELPYLYCNLCSRKEYRLARVGMECKRFTYGNAIGDRARHCAGTLTLSMVNSVTIDQPDAQDAS